MNDTVARLSTSFEGRYLVAAGPCKYPYARLGEGKIHRTTNVAIRFRTPEPIDPVSVCLKCRPGLAADSPRLRLLSDGDLPTDEDAYCVRCFGVRLPSCVLVPSKAGAA